MAGPPGWLATYGTQAAAMATRLTLAAQKWCRYRLSVGDML